MTAGKSIDPAAAAMILKDYVDDGYSGGRDSNVVWLMGETRDENGKICYKGTVPTIMAQGGFNIKIII